MGNDLEKQYNLKQKPLKLPGSYSFLKYAEHPTDNSSSLLIIKSPHKAGIISSQILLPIKQVKNIGYSDYTIATCKKCKPLGLVRPRSQPQMKLIIRQIIKLSCQFGRIFLCDGRLMLWCEQVRSTWCRAPQQIQYNKQTQKSKVFWAGICLVNFLHSVYDKDSKKKRQKKPQIESFFDPKDKKEYYDFVDNLQYKLSKSSFWTSVSQGMKNLIIVMMAKEQNQRIDFKTILLLPYFATQKQLRLYHMLTDQMLQWNQKQSIIVMQTIQMVIHDRVIFDQLVLNDYLRPILTFLLQKKPQLVISAVSQLPDPPTYNIVACVKKSSPKNVRLFNTIITKIQKFHSILSQDEYDSVISRTAFCSFELQVLINKIIRVIPFIIKTVKQPNYKKQIELQLLTNIIQKKDVDKSLLLVGLKCVIQLLRQDLISNISKLFNIKFNPEKFSQELQINLHILEMYRLMILAIQPHQLIGVMMPKLDPFLSIEQLSDELFICAKNCVDIIMRRLVEFKNLAEQEIQIKYNQQFFNLAPVERPPHSQLVSVLKKQASKSKNPDIVWLTQILEKQEALVEL